MITDAAITAFILKWAALFFSWVWAHTIVTGLAVIIVGIMAAAATRPDDHKEARE